MLLSPTETCLLLGPYQPKPRNLSTLAVAGAGGDSIRAQAIVPYTAGATILPLGSAVETRQAVHSRGIVQKKVACGCLCPVQPPDPELGRYGSLR